LELAAACKISAPATVRRDVIGATHSVRFTKKAAHLAIVGKGELADRERRWDLRNEAAERDLRYGQISTSMGAPSFAVRMRPGRCGGPPGSAYRRYCGAVCVRCRRIAPRSRS